MPYSCFAKEIRNYARACEHLIGESVTRSNQFTEQELQLVNYYADEIVRLVIRKPSSLEFKQDYSKGSKDER
jgi:hypothetical protein